MRRIEITDLDALNLVLARNPGLADVLIAKLDAINVALGPVLTQPAVPAGDEQTMTAAWESKVLAWFTTNGGKHPLATVREALGAAEGSKPFKTAVTNLVNAKTLQFSGKRGKGAEYWVK